MPARFNSRRHDAGPIPATDLSSRMLGQTASCAWLESNSRWRTRRYSTAATDEILRRIRRVPERCSRRSAATRRPRSTGTAPLAERPLAESLVFENIDQRCWLDELVPGVNVLAIHGVERWRGGRRFPDLSRTAGRHGDGRASTLPRSAHAGRAERRPGRLPRVRRRHHVQRRGGFFSAADLQPV